MQILNGFIRCNIQSTGTGHATGTTTVYNDQQLHQWVWANNPPFPIPNQMPTAYNMSATWSVSGRGSETETDDSNGNVKAHTYWTTSGSSGVRFRIWLDSTTGLINVTTPSSISMINNPGYWVTQDIVGGMPQNPRPYPWPVQEPPLPQTEFFQGSPGIPIGRGSFLLYGLRFNLQLTMGRWIFSADPSFFGTMQQQMFQKSGYAPPAFVTSSATWVWRIFV